MTRAIGALIYASCAEHALGARRLPIPDARVAGLTLLERAILTARAAGAGPVVVVADPESNPRHHPRLPPDVIWVRPDTVVQALRRYSPETSWLVQPSWVVTDTACVRFLYGHADDAGPVRLVAEGVAAPAARDSVWLVDGRVLQVALHGREPLEDELTGAKELTIPPAAFCLGIPDGARLADADRRLRLHASDGIDTDGWVDRVFNRYVSRAFTRLVLDARVTPNQITVLHSVLGLLAALCLASPTYRWSVLGALLFQLSVALDCADGEVARLKLQFSRAGAMLDVIGDNVVHAAVFLAIGLAAKRTLGAALAVTLGAAAVVGIVMGMLVVWALMAWQRHRAAAGKRVGYGLAPVAASHAAMGDASVDAPRSLAGVDALLNQLTSRDFSVLVVAAALLGHPEWVLWLAAVGTHVFWIGFLALQLYVFKVTDAALA
jgi:phosphatidylglycerophosphate synthase